MEMSGERQIAASRSEVWAALNDPEVLKACIPGCQEIAVCKGVNPSFFLKRPAATLFRLKAEPWMVLSG